jgi:hypothetical protein
MNHTKRLEAKIAELEARHGLSGKRKQIRRKARAYWWSLDSATRTSELLNYSRKGITDPDLVRLASYAGLD